MQLSKGVLVIEDEEFVRDLVVDILELEQMKVFAAGDGETGLDLYRRYQNEIECVLLDVTMPGLTGGETLAALHQMNPNVKVVLTSGHESSRVQSLVDQYRVTFIQKPYMPDALLNTLRKSISC